MRTIIHTPFTLLFCVTILIVSCDRRPIPVNVILLRDSRTPGLHSLSLSCGRLSPEFSPIIHYYKVELECEEATLLLNAEAAEPDMSILIEGELLNENGCSVPIEIIGESNRTIHIEILQDENIIDLYRIEMTYRE